MIVKNLRKLKKEEISKQFGMKSGLLKFEDNTYEENRKLNKKINQIKKTIKWARNYNQNMNFAQTNF